MTDPAPAKNDPDASREVSLCETGESLPTTARTDGRGIASADLTERRDADVEVFERARRADFRGREWELFSERLVRHGGAVLGGWVATGRIFAVTASKNVHLQPSEEELTLLARDSDLRREIVHSAIAEALIRFRRSAIDGSGWRSDGGASLGTYFINGCLFGFAEELKARRRTDPNWPNSRVVVVDPLDPEDGRLERPADVAADPADRVVEHDTMRAQLATLSPRDRIIVWGKVIGETNREIAVHLDSTEKAVERRHSRLMRQHSWISSLTTRRKPT